MIDRSLRFCMITTFYPPYNFGGDGIFVYRLSNELAKLGHQVDVIHCIDSYRLLAKKKPTANHNDHINVAVHGLKSPFGFLSPLATQQTGFPLFKSAQIQQVLKKGFDVIHYHNISLVGGPKILEYGEAIKLYTMHDYWLICPMHVLFKFCREPCLRPQCFFCSLKHKRPPQWWRYSSLLKNAIKNVDAFIAPGYFSEEKHLEMGLDVPIVNLPNFVPSTDEMTSIPQEVVPSGDPYFLFVGRLEKIKGLQTLIPLFQRCPKTQLLIVGEGKYQSQLQQLAKGYRNIQFLGHLPYQQLRTIYQKAVALIVPSLCFENFPLVIIEAYREQTPVIVRNLGGMAKLVEESGGGIVYESDEELMKAMDHLLEDPSSRNDLGQRGYHVHLQNWTTEAYLTRYFDLIHAIKTTMKQ